MSNERVSYVNSKDVGAFWNSVKPREQGVDVLGKYYPKAIAVIGGGTGLESLRIARANPKSAVFVIDPLSQFGGEVINQMAAPSYKQHRKIDWSFFDKSPDLINAHPYLWEAYKEKPEVWKKVNAAFNHYSNDIKELSQRIFFLETMTTDHIPDEPLFDRIDLIFPNPQLYVEPTIYQFASRGLRKGGQWNIVTEMAEAYLHFFGHEQKYVAAHGTLEKEGKTPLSVYDIIFGERAYSYVDIVKSEDRLNEPNLMNIFLAQLPVWAFVQIVREVTSARKNKKFRT